MQAAAPEGSSSYRLIGSQARNTQHFIPPDVVRYIKMKTKTYILLIGMTLFPSSIFSQAIVTGKYEAWFDICDKTYNHFCMQLDIDSTGLVEVTYKDDTQIKKSIGKISFVKDSILLTPLNESDSIVIDEVIDITLNKWISPLNNQT